MTRIDSDYLWLQDRPQSASARLRIALLLLTVALFITAVWYAAGVLDDLSTAVADPSPSRTHEPGTRRADVGAQKTNPDRATAARSPDRPRSSFSSVATGWQQVPIRRGDTLSIAFHRAHLSYLDAIRIAHLPDYGDHFTRGLKPGDVLRVRADRHGAIQALSARLDTLHTLRIRRRGSGFAGHVVAIDVAHRRAVAAGTIRHSFYTDAIAAGLTERQVLELGQIFAWKIDFASELRPGDRFVVVYDALYRDARKLGNGDILAAALINRGHAYRALRYQTPDGRHAYYTPAGRPLDKTFARAPLDYTRISSGFNLSREHPILHRIRHHLGTDYAAPMGTPIHATGHGRVIFRGRRGGYGNIVTIRHSGRITTRYGHMQRFARGLHAASIVDAGQVIGYVGMTGLATGPHLHYEFRVNGQAKDPQTIELPGAPPLARRYRADFTRRVQPLIAELNTRTHTTVARNDDRDFRQAE